MKKKMIALIAAVLLLSGCSAQETASDKERDTVADKTYENNCTDAVWSLEYGILDYYLPEDTAFSKWEWPLDDTEVTYGAEGSAMYFGIAPFGPENTARLDYLSEIYSEFTFEELDGEPFTHHMLAEKEDQYYEVFLIYDKQNPVTEEYYYFAAALEIFNDEVPDEAYREKLIEDFQGVIDSMHITYCTEEEYEKIKYGE